MKHLYHLIRTAQKIDTFTNVDDVVSELNMAATSNEPVINNKIKELISTLEYAKSIGNLDGLHNAIEHVISYIPSIQKDSEDNSTIATLGRAKTKLQSSLPKSNNLTQPQQPGRNGGNKIKIIENCFDILLRAIKQKDNLRNPKYINAFKHLNMSKNLFNSEQIDLFNQIKKHF